MLHPSSFKNEGIGVGTTNMGITLQLTITLANIIHKVVGSWTVMY